MDSKKALRIIIILLLIVNIFMTIYITNLAFSEPKSEDELKHVIQLLEYRDIKLECDIPQYAAPSAELIYIEADNTEILNYLSNIEGLLNEDEVTKQIIFNPNTTQRYENFSLDLATQLSDSFVENLPVKSESYMLDSILTAGVNIYKFSYFYVDGSSYIYDKKIEITISRDGIDQVVISNVNYQVSDTEYNRATVSIGNILASGFIRQGQSFITIKKIDAGYLYNEETSSIMNVWRVMYNNGQERYFSSVDGTIINKN